MLSSNRGGIRIRNVERDDLSRMVDMQLDTESNRQAETISWTVEAISNHNLLTSVEPLE